MKIKIKNWSGNEQEITIPRGWRRVTRGICHSRDRVWDCHSNAFRPPTADPNAIFVEVGEPVSEFYCVIRRIRARSN